MTKMSISPATVYMIGSGRSGTTLLDLLLNNSEYVQSLGEVHRLNMVAKTNQGACMCGELVTSCPFWQKVQAEAEAALKTGAEGGLLKQKDMMMYPDDVGRVGTWLQKAVLVLGNRFLFLLSSKLFGAAHLQAGENSFFWFDMVRRATGRPIVVDSTKDARRLKVLYLLNPDPIKIIYMVRDGRAVAASAMRRKNESMATAVRSWIRRNRATMAVLRSIPKEKILFVKYETLCNEPAKTLSGVLEFLGLPFDHEMLELKKDVAHNIGGNPMRFRRDQTTIQLDDKWRDQLVATDLKVFDQLAGWLNRKLGYHN